MSLLGAPRQPRRIVGWERGCGGAGRVAGQAAGVGARVLL